MSQHDAWYESESNPPGIVAEILSFELFFSFENFKIFFKSEWGLYYDKN